VKAESSANVTQRKPDFSAKDNRDLLVETATMLWALNQSFGEHQSEMEKVRNRLGKLEDWKAWSRGVLAALGVIHVVVLGLVGWLIALLTGRWRS
jgi:hypothetical protein